MSDGFPGNTRASRGHSSDDFIIPQKPFTKMTETFGARFFPTEQGRPEIGKCRQFLSLAPLNRYNDKTSRLPTAIVQIGSRKLAEMTEKCRNAH